MSRTPLFGSQTRPVIVAHRGASSAAPENTLSALSTAMQATRNLAGIEIDVQFSADGHAILYHDEFLDKVGRTGTRVEDLGVAQLTELEIRGERIPTLSSVLALFARPTRLLLELKVYGDLEGDPMLRCRRADALLGELLPLGKAAAKWLMVLCFDHQVLRLMHVQAPHLRYVLNIGDRLPAPEELATTGVSHLSALCVDIEILEPDFMAFARAQGLPVLVYTCNRPAQVDRALALGVDAILADDPAWLAGYLETLPRPGLPTAS